MAKPKMQTLIEGMGFKDEDRKSPFHDKITKWLFYAVDKYLAEWVGYNPVWTVEDINMESPDRSYGREGYDSTSKERDVLNMDIPKKPSFEIVFKDLEHIMKDGIGRMVGAIDFFVSYRHNKLYYDRSNGNFKIFNEQYNYTAYFEVKTQIQSFGELLRQINIYKDCAARLYKSKWFVVAPSIDPDEVGILKEQGIGFIKYDPAV